VKAASVLLAAAVLLGGPTARAENLATFPKDAEKLPAVRYAALGPAECKAELLARKVPFEEDSEPAPGVLIPVRLTGPVNGVLYRTALSESARKTSPWEVFDCRLVLALYDFGTILDAHQIDEAWIFSAWRPPPDTWEEGRIADRHPGALAVDIQKFHRKGGDWLVVEKDYHGRIRSQTCGPRKAAPRPATRNAMELRAIVCEAAEAHIFNAMLTPNYNRAHKNHMHLEVKAGVTWFLVR
jgi:Extensin-like protein C-terminus